MLGARDLRMQPGLLLVSTHRASGDVPILCGSLYFPARVWAERRWHPHFVARDEFFERGFLAGYPANSPLWLRRLLYPISLASGLSRARTLSLCSGKTMKLAQALAQLPPDTPLVQVLPPPLLEQVRARAQRLHASPPATARALLRGEYADLLWETVTAQELSAPQLARVWRRRRAQARESMGALSDLVRSGQPLLMFPEGNHSPDGEIGPLRPGLGVLVSDGAPQALAYMAIAYDPLTLGRPRAFLSFNAPLAPPAQDVVAEALHELKRAMPLSCGQVLGYALVQASAAGHTSLEVPALERRIAVAAQVASQLGRRIDPALGDAKGIRRRLDDGLAALARRHGIALQGQRVVFDSERIRDDEVLLRLAREYASARGILLSSPAPPARHELRPAPRAAGA